MSIISTLNEDEEEAWSKVTPVIGTSTLGNQSSLLEVPGHLKMAMQNFSEGEHSEENEDDDLNDV